MSPPPAPPGALLHPSLARPVLYAGLAPEFLFFEVAAAFLLLFEVVLHLVTLALSLLYALVFHPAAAHLCSRDPLIALVPAVAGADRRSCGLWGAASRLYGLSARGNARPGQTRCQPRRP